MELKKGIKLKSKWFKGIIVIDHINEEDNDLEVNITNELGHTHHENWNLQHTIWGLENGDYWITDEEFPVEKTEHCQGICSIKKTDCFCYDNASTEGKCMTTQNKCEHRKFIY